MRFSSANRAPGNETQDNQPTDAIVVPGRVSAKIPILICLCIVLGMLAVGLNPFGRPHNNVNWLATRSGLLLTGHSIILSQGAFTTATGTKEATSSLEIWLQPDRTNGSAAILGFSVPEEPNQLLLERFDSSLILTREKPKVHRQRIGLEHVFQQAKTVFITITSGPAHTDIYLDGTLAETFPGFRLEKDMTGRLVIGTAPEGGSSWHGEVRGLALYSRELNAEQVSRHYATWTQDEQPAVSHSEGAIAVYLFNEHGGDTVHNSIANGMNLIIPERYFLLRQKFLEPFWEELGPPQSTVRNIFINVIGFIPLGLAHFAFWSFIRPSKLAVLRTLAVGFAVSLTIEVLQSFLPTRSSGTADLIMNTLGTYLGVVLCRLGTVRNLISRLCRGLSPYILAPSLVPELDQ